MGIHLINRKGSDVEFSNTVWAYVLNLGELYGWIPLGTRKPKNVGFFSKWSGNYDSSDGQVVTTNDSLSLSSSLKKAISDNGFEYKADKLRNEIQSAIEANIGQKLDYDVIPEISVEFIKQLIEFFECGEFTIN